MSSRRQRTHGQGALLPPSARPLGLSQNSALPVPGSNGNGHANGHQNGALPQAAPGLPPALRPDSAPVPSEALGAFAAELAIFNRRIEDLLDRERPPARPEDRKETWVLLAALAVVVMFCFVAFYLNQSELRDLHSNLQDEIDRAAHTASSSVERAIGGFHLERLPQTQAELERFLKEKDRRDTQRWAELTAEMERQTTRSGGLIQEDLQQIQDQLEALRRIAGEIQRASPGLAAAPAAGSPEGAESGAAHAVPAIEVKSEAREGRAAGTPVGAPEETPPVPAARPPDPRASVPSGTVSKATVEPKNQTGSPP